MDKEMFIVLIVLIVVVVVVVAPGVAVGVFWLNKTLLIGTRG
jgi:flagellar basal body-associated protein FliL